MLVEFSIIPVGGDRHTSDELAEALTLVDQSGLKYQLTPAGTCVEGEWDEVMRVVQACVSRRGPETLAARRHHHQGGRRRGRARQAVAQRGVD